MFQHQAELQPQMAFNKLDYVGNTSRWWSGRRMFIVMTHIPCPLVDTV